MKNYWMQNYWIPVRPNGNTRVETLPGAQNLGEIDDAKIKPLSINDIDTTTKEGKWLLSALAKISTESQTDKHPDEILEQVDKVAKYIFCN